MTLEAALTKLSAEFNVAVTVQALARPRAVDFSLTVTCPVMDGTQYHTFTAYGATFEAAYKKMRKTLRLVRYESQKAVEAIDRRRDEMLQDIIREGVRITNQ